MPSVGPSDEKERRQMINSLGRGLQALTLLAQAEGPLGVTELAGLLGVDPSSSYRILATLEQHGFVAQQARGKKYVLGFAPLMLAEAVHRRLDAATLAGPYLSRLVRAVGESAHLAVLDGSQVIFVSRETATARLRVETTVGVPEPAHCTAVGKALLAGLAPAEVAALYPTGVLVRYTDQTITGLDELADELGRVRARGYAYDDQEVHPGVRCLAAPVRGHEGAVVAAMGLSGPTARITRERLPALASLVREAAASLSEELGYPRSEIAPAPARTG
jgi:DNA-binding IclR family transcriptional regulator